MKNELGIEVCCANCYLIFDCNLPVENACRINGQHLSFMPSIEACSTRIKEMQKLMREEADAIDIGVSALNTYYEARIKKIQEQQFTEEELQFIKDRLDECIEEWDMPEMVFMAHQILKKIEQTLKNSEENLKNER